MKNEGYSCLFIEVESFDEEGRPPDEKKEDSLGSSRTTSFPPFSKGTSLVEGLFASTEIALGNVFYEE